MVIKLLMNGWFLRNGIDTRLMKLDSSKLNEHGDAVSSGRP